ncbi:hypothetical protein OKW21_004917 [Catalinimonas alkaloidigena]|uniref:DUF6940 family protein n=1 Tax=Catalinimonas alkaloidigena TaxID=1075417 RepID=UPI00240589B2|nr:hypothetical protein [Catalinimonas alkaloidigena]MDF9799654.1 hypothetical protein [Catalinimonas alkaloidigena]
MWKATSETLQKGKVFKYYLSERDHQLTFSNVLRLWQESIAFCDFFSSILAEAPFSAFFWECPPLTKSSILRPFEFVLVNSLQLSKVEPDTEAFRQYFSHTDQPVCDFCNLGRDAHLLVPVPESTAHHYPHLATFVRHADTKQQRALWERLGKLI